MKWVGNHDKNGTFKTYFNVAVSEILINNFSKYPCDLFLARRYNFVTLCTEPVGIVLRKVTIGSLLTSEFVCDKSYDWQCSSYLRNVTELCSARLA